MNEWKIKWMYKNNAFWLLLYCMHLNKYYSIFCKLQYVLNFEWDVNTKDPITLFIIRCGNYLWVMKHASLIAAFSLISVLVSVWGGGREGEWVTSQIS